MADFRVEHAFNCSEETFWTKIFFDDEYNRRLFSERLKFSAWRELQREERDGKIYRTIEAAPPIGDLPGALKAVVGDNAGYQEKGVFDRAKRLYSVEVIPNRLADKINIKLQMTTTPDGDERCRRQVTGSVAAKIFGVGGMLEKKLIADMEKSYEKSAAFTNAFLAEKGLR